MTTVTIHGLDEARRALAAARGPLTLVSAPGAGGHGGAGWFAAMERIARAEFPDVPQRWILDCADAPGHALAALRAGVRVVALAEGPASAALRDIAAQLGAEIVAPP